MPRSLIVIALTLLLAGCGWQLRGSVDLGDLDRLHLAGEQHSAIGQQVQQVLQANGVALSDTASGVPGLTLGAEHLERRTAALSAGALAAEYQLLLRLPYQISAADGSLVASDTLQVERSYSFDPNDVVGKAEEERLLIEEMRRDLAQQLVRRLRFAELGAPAADSPASE